MGAPFTHPDIRAYAMERVGHFAEPLASFIDRTAVADTHRWEIIDRNPVKQWSKGRAMPAHVIRQLDDIEVSRSAA